MTAPAAATVRYLPPRPAASLKEWASAINLLAARAGIAGSGRRGAKPAKRDEADRGDASRQQLLMGCRIVPDVAEHLAIHGLDPDFLADFAGFSGLDLHEVLDFAGIDRTTVSRRKASGSGLPQDVAVKALQITDLVTQAIEVFGSPMQASTWLTRPHPSLDGATPLKRARTPWGMSKVQSMLVALRYGAAA